MFEDLAKVLVYGYVGLAIEKNNREENAKLQSVIQSLQQNVVIVCDGKAPSAAAKSLRDYIKILGYETMIVSQDVCREWEKNPFAGKYLKKIIIGHHDFTKEHLEDSKIVYDRYGMKIGQKGPQCVLRVSRSELGYGRKGRQKFAEYYNEKLPSYSVLAKKFNVPFTFGKREETRQSQYDLLWLEFSNLILPGFLETYSAEAKERYT